MGQRYWRPYRGRRTAFTSGPTLARQRAEWSATCGGSETAQPSGSARAARGVWRLRDHRAIDSEVFFYIRRTRAHPPGHAGEEDRRATYGTALEQFEELLAAAATASPGVRPLPLFYALSQAGRAIAAANLADAWKLRGHGISCGDLAPESVLDLEIKPWSDPDPAKPDSFHGVSCATACEAPRDAVKLGALWLALPQVSRLIADLDGVDRWPEALLAMPPEPTTSPLERFDRVDAALLSWQHPDGASLVAELPKYPNSKNVAYEEIPGIGIRVTLFPYGSALNVHWPAEKADVAGRQNTLDRIVPGAPGGDRWWRPRVGGAAMNDLMVWWALLFGLSMLARYEPAGWAAMLDLDDNPTAAHLVRLMDAAVDVVPELVLQVLEPGYAM
jgi:hypothetical protein